MRTKAASNPAMLLLVLMMLLSGPAVLGVPLEGEFTADTPEKRTALWKDSLERFLTQHPLLSAEQQTAILDARDAAREEMFLDAPEVEEKEALSLALTALQKGLDCPRLYAKLLSEMGALGYWFQIQGVGSPLKANCNCGNGGCARKFECISSGCSAEPGTTNWGICQPDEK